jgi:hypothetical protein
MACRDYETAGARKRNPALKWWADPKERVLGLILLDKCNASPVSVPSQHLLCCHPMVQSIGVEPDPAVTGAIVSRDRVPERGHLPADRIRWLIR